MDERRLAWAENNNKLMMLTENIRQCQAYEKLDGVSEKFNLKIFQTVA